MYSSLLRLDSFLSRRKNSSRIDVCSSYSNVDRNITVETLPFYHKILRYFSFTVTGGAIIPLYFLTSNFVNNVSLVISEKMWRVLHNAMLVVPSARMRMNKNIVFFRRQYRIYRELLHGGVFYSMHSIHTCFPSPLKARENKIDCFSYVKDL